MRDQRLAAIRQKDTVIATYQADTLVQSPGIVESVYAANAITHISMGDTSTAADRLIHWTRHNKGCVIGAIVGPYGYGKTSTAIHLWRYCEQNNVIAVPPFTWTHLDQIIEVTNSWLDYRLGLIAPDLRVELQALYERYRTRSLEALSVERGVALSDLEGLLRDGLLKLETSPGDVVGFLGGASALLARVGRDGPVVFTDELQVTLSEYPSRDEFMEDLFGLLNTLHQRQGSYGIVFSMPTGTEALIADVRGDIIHRMQTFNLYIRPDTMYGRSFAADLWRKYAHLFEFTDMMSAVLPQDTLKSIGQIASRKDLGSGPRTVIDSLQRAVDHFDATGEPYMPIDLLDAYLAGEIAYDQGGKLRAATRDALDSAPVAGNLQLEAAIKLLAAFPEGCPEDVQHRFGLAASISELPAVYRREYIHEFAEGPSLRKLAPTEVKAEPVFLRLTKEFINRYKEDERHGLLASAALRGMVLHGPVLPERRGNSLLGWVWESDNILNGAFSERYPDRRLYVRAISSPEALDTSVEIDELGLWLHLDLSAGAQDLGEIVRVDGRSNRTLVRLNATLRPPGPLNIAYVNELGVPSAKLTPLFLLSLLQHLEQNRPAVPNEEQARGMKTFMEQLLSNAIRILFNNDLREHSDWSLSLVGAEMVKDIVNRMCETSYPSYVTFITAKGWDSAATLYESALKNRRMPTSAARGRQTLRAGKDEIVRLFGQTSSQGFQNLQKSIPHLLELVDWSGRTDGEVSLRLHPLAACRREGFPGAYDTITECLDNSAQ